MRRGLVSEQRPGQRGYPQNIWAVTPDGIALEAQLENADKGSYHGYPMAANDPLRSVVLSRWK